MLRRILAAGLFAGVLATAPPAGASSNPATWRPTILNGGLPYGSYRTERRGYPEVCFQYVGKPDRCYRIAAYAPAPWFGGLA